LADERTVDRRLVTGNVLDRTVSHACMTRSNAPGYTVTTFNTIEALYSIYSLTVSHL